MRLAVRPGVRRRRPWHASAPARWLKRSVVLAAVGLATLALLAAQPSPAGAQSPEQLEAQALQVEKQLLCPRCTNIRLDQCELAICEDMRLLIRERLEAGSSSDDILLYFSNRFGERVLAQLPRSGFNLFLFGWVGGSILLVAVAGTAVLLQLRRTANAPAASLSDADDEWLDAQIERGDSP